MSFISLESITKTYYLGEKKIEALKSIDMEIDKGEFTSIMGVSGSGKSTLLYIIGLMDTPSSGKYYFMDKNVSELSLESRAEIRSSHIGFVFQQFHLIDYLSSLENVLLPLLYSTKEFQDPASKAKELLSNLGLEGRYDNKPSELSGGEQQRVAIARALINDPEIILADEPTGQLDNKTSKGIMEIFTKLNNEGKTILMVTHDPDMAAYSKKVIIIKDGKFV